MQSELLLKHGRCASAEKHGDQLWFAFGKGRGAGMLGVKLGKVLNPKISHAKVQGSRMSLKTPRHGEQRARHPDSAITTIPRCHLLVRFDVIYSSDTWNHVFAGRYRTSSNISSPALPQMENGDNLFSFSLEECSVQGLVVRVIFKQD